jgi:hypothetical protein
MNELKSCRSCGVRFDGERWQRLCWECWRRERGRSDLDVAYRRGYRDGYDLARREGHHGAPSAGLTAELLAGAIQLCHPDRHPAERTAVANAVTAKLLELRGSA